MQTNRPIVLSIAGFDPCGGAGVLADSKTFEQLKTQGMAVITANTIQIEDQFLAIEWLAIKTIEDSINFLMNRYSVKVIKIGIVKDALFLNRIIHTVKSKNPEVFIIWDPVINSSSGHPFFNKNEIPMLTNIVSKIDLITPNFEEFQLLESVLKKGSNVLVKGGHRKEQIGVDLLKTGHKEITILPTAIQLPPKHGSGCVLSAAIAAHKALDFDLETACRLGKKYVEHYLNSHPSLLGHHHD